MKAAERGPAHAHLRLVIGDRSTIGTKGSAFSAARRRMSIAIVRGRAGAVVVVAVDRADASLMHIGMSNPLSTR